jgi:hypothetical protein
MIKPGHPFWGKSTAECVITVLKQTREPMRWRDIYAYMIRGGFVFVTGLPGKTIDQHLAKLARERRILRISRGVYSAYPAAEQRKLRRGSRGIAPIDLRGRRFGSLVVDGITDRSGRGRHRYWMCLCDCGSSKEIRGDALLNGYHLSCGCGRSAASKERANHQRRGINGRWENVNV